MRRLWPSRLVARAPRTRAIRYARAPLIHQARLLHASPSTYNTPRRKDTDAPEEIDADHSAPPSSPGAFNDQILSLTQPQDPAEGLVFLQPLQDALLSAFLPINQHVGSLSTGSPKAPPTPFGHPHGSFQVLQSSVNDLSEPAREAVVAVTSPFEGGRCYSFDAVKLIASTLDAEVLRLDLVLGIGLNGSGTTFDKVPAAPSLPTSMNPPLQDQKVNASPRVDEPHEMDEEDSMEDAEDEPETRAIVVSPMFPQQGGRGSGGGGSPVEGVKEPWVKFFTNILGANAGVKRRRVIYLEAADSMAPSFGVWWQSLIEAVRKYRRGKGREKSAPDHEVAIVLSFSPSLLPQHAAPPPSSSAPSSLDHMPASLRFLMSQNARPPPGTPLWYGGPEADFAGREDRVTKRLSQMGEGENDSLIPTLSIKSPKPSLPLPLPILQMLGQDGPNAEQDLFSRIIWKNIPVLPEKRDRRREQLERLTSRLAMSAAILHNALAPYGARVGDLDEALQDVGSQTMYRKAADRSSRTTYAIPQERRAAHAFESINATHIEWQNNIISSEAAQRVASTATGNRLRADRDLDLLWSDIVSAAEDESELSSMFKRHITSFAPAKTTTRPQGQTLMTPSKAKESTSSIIASVKTASDLSTYERRLLPCIVDSSRLSTGTFDNVHLPIQTVDTIRTLVTLPLLYPDAFRSGVLRDHSTTGALLFGPPGTGKTLLARAVANESGARMIAIQPSDVNDKYLGEGEKLVKGIFSLARRLAPCVVFIDEVDSLFGARAGKSGASAGNRHHDQLLTEFMQEMDGLSSAEANTKKGIVVIGATNRPFDLDDAILRRLPRRLLVDLPDVKSRKAILEIMLKGENKAEDVDLDHIAKETDGFSGSDLKHLCVSAALSAIKEVVKVPWTTREEVLTSETLQTPNEPDATSKSADSDEILLTTDGDAESESEDTHEDIGKTVDAPPVLPLHRTLSRRHFETALKEIRPSSSEEGTLPELRKWAEQFGEGGSQRGRKKGFGKGFGFSDPTTKTRHEAGYGRVTQE